MVDAEMMSGPLGNHRATSGQVEVDTGVSTVQVRAAASSFPD